MTTPKKYLGRKAARATVRHSVRGTVAKARREPPRTITLLGIGALVGALLGVVVGRATTPRPELNAAPRPYPA
jgi:hypothetical protein